MRSIGTLLIGLALLADQSQATAEAEKIDYFGYSGCVALQNDDIRVVLTTHGGRILEYSRDGENAIHLDPARRAGSTCRVNPLSIPRAVGWTSAPRRSFPADPNCGWESGRQRSPAPARHD